MDSATIKSAFAASGIKVRVMAMRMNGFRVCTVDASAHTDRSQTVAASLGMTNSAGILGGNINQQHEMFCYASGQFRRV